MQFEPHPLRSAVISEVHARPYAEITPPRRVLHFAFMCNAELAEKDRNAFSSYCAERGQRGPDRNARFHKLDLANGLVRWEQHTEFITYSWGFPDNDKTPFETAATSFMQVMQGLPQPGPHLVSVDLLYTEKSLVADWKAIFDESSLTACHTAEGKALAATDFRMTTDGFIRFLVLGDNVAPVRAGALVLQLLEMETYRSLCLLGLPMAHELQPQISASEQQLAAVTSQLLEAAGIDTNRSLLQKITSLAGEIEASSSKSQYRFAASWAYYQIVRNRVEELKEEQVGELPTLSRFLERRIAPAVRTCGTVEDRQERLAEKLARAANLLRTRVDIELEQQNADILKSMNRRSDQQLRLQQTVEGLSIAAISYYVVQLLYQVLAPVLVDAVMPEKLLKAALVVVSVAVVAILVRKIRLKHTSV